MWRLTNRAILFFASTAIVFLLVAGTARAQAGVTTHTGTLADGATFLIEVPANWNGTLFLYSHGYVVPGSSNPAQASFVAPRAYIEFDPSRYLRPFDALMGECEFGFLCADPFLPLGLQ
jgi:hypothetical protein